MVTETCCAECGAALPTGMLGNRCPRCLVRLALATGPEPPAPGEPARIDGLRQRFGDYELLEKVAEGGMGVVYRARQVSLDRIVAVKMIQPGRVGSAEMVLRFRAEAEAAAGLHHPNIVAIHETGEFEGQHYFSMDYIEGKNLAEAVREGPFPSVRAAQVVEKIASAVHYAHQHKVLHRDLKPSNVILDEAGEPQVMDFGLAKRLTSDVGARTSDLTLTGQVFGSPRFMPPEQASGRRGALGVHSDVYGLGAILYYLLAARPPFVGETMETTLAQVLGREPVSPRLLNASVPRDLETICLKCLEKEPSRRYASAQALADELGRFVRSEPILARPVGFLGKARRWCRRKPALATALGAVVLVAAAGFVGVLSQWHKAKASELFARQNAYAADMNLLQVELEKGNLGGAVALLNAQRPGPGQKDLRGWEWRYFWQRCRSDERFLFCRYSDSIGALAFSADGKWLALRRERGAVGLWDTVTRKSVAEFPSRGTLKPLAFSPQHTLLALGNVETNGRPMVSLWNIPTRQEVRLLHSSAVRHLAFSQDGTLLATMTTDGTVSLWQIASGQVVTNFQASPPRTDSDGRILFSANGRLLAVAETNGIRLSEWTSGKRRAIAIAEPGDGVTALAFSPDGQLLAAGCRLADNQIHVWDLANFWDSPTGSGPPVVGHLVGHRSWICDLVFAPDGRTLASASGDQTVRLWDPRRMQEIGRYQGNTHEVWAVAFSPDGKDLVSGGRDGTIRYWDPEEKPPVPPHQVLPIPAWSGGFAFAPDGQRFIALDNRDGTASLWETATVRLLEPLTFLGTNNSAVKWSPDGRILAVGDRLGNLGIWDLVTRRSITNFVIEGTRIAALRFHGGGRLLWCGAVFLGSGNVRMGKVWTVGDWRDMPLPVEALKDGKWSTISPDSRTFAALTGDGTVAWWDFPSGRKLAEFKHHFASADGSLTFSPDGRTLAGSTTEGLITLWHVPTGRILANLRGNVGAVHGVAFSPDGRRLLSGGKDATDVVRLMDVGSMRYVARFPGDPDDFRVVEMSAEGNTLVAVGMKHTALFWRAPSWAEIEAAEKGAVAR